MEFVKRPVAVFTMSYFVFFCAITNFIKKSDTVMLIASGVLFAAFLILRFALSGKKRTLVGYLCLGAAGVLAAVIFASAFFYPSISKHGHLAGDDHTLCGTVTDKLWSSNGSNCYALDVSEVDGGKDSFGAALVTSSWHEAGDVVKAKCSVTKIDDSFDNEKYYLSKGLILNAEADYAQNTGKESSVRLFFSKLNDKLSAALRNNLSEESGAVADAVLLGNRENLSDRTTSALSRLGVSHLIAISGMHVSFICIALTIMLRNLHLGKKKIALVMIAAMIFYMFLAGFSPSVTRAVFICCVCSLATIFGISFDGITALSLCGASMVLIDPFVSLSVAMQLSFSAYAGCFAASKLLKKADSVKDRVGEGFFRNLGFRIVKILIFTFTIVIFSLPVTLLYYKRISVLAPIANLIFIPAFSLILYFASITLVLSPVAPLCKAVSLVADKFIGAVLRAADAASSVKGTQVSLRYPFSLYIIAAACVSLILIVIGRKKLAKIAAVCLAACVVLYGAGIAVYNANRPAVAAARVGGKRGEALVLSSGGVTALCDLSGGNRSVVRSGLGALDELCLTELDCYIMTRCGTSQIREVRELAETQRLSSVYINREGADDGAYEKVLSILDEYGAEAHELPLMPDTLKIGDAELSFFRSKGIVCFKIAGGAGSAVYLGSGWADVCPNCPESFKEFDNVIFGSSGKTPEAKYESTKFDKCKIYSFVDGDCVSGLSGITFPDINSTFVLNID